MLTAKESAQLYRTHHEYSRKQIHLCPLKCFHDGSH